MSRAFADHAGVPMSDELPRTQRRSFHRRPRSCPAQGQRLTCPPFIGSPSHARTVVRSIPRARFEWAPNGSPAVLPGCRRRPNDESFFRHAIASRSSRLHVSRRLGFPLERIHTPLSRLRNGERPRCESCASDVAARPRAPQDRANRHGIPSLDSPSSLRSDGFFAALLLAPCSQLARCLLHRHS